MEQSSCKKRANIKRTWWTQTNLQWDAHGALCRLFTQQTLFWSCDPASLLHLPPKNPMMHLYKIIHGKMQCSLLSAFNGEHLLLTEFCQSDIRSKMSVFSLHPQPPIIKKELKMAGDPLRMALSQKV